MDTARATSFGAWADEYDQWRPTYPDAAVDWLVPPDGGHVVEVGAGTGKLTDRRCVWNIARLQHDWEWRALRLDPALQPPVDADALDHLGLSIGRAEQSAFRWTWMLTPQQWRGYVSTVSHVRLLPEGERREVLDETEQLVARACASTGDTTAPLTFDALCVRWYPTL